MLWNWDTIDTCFISKTWHIRSTGMFAGSCIGVILLVMTLEFLRRVVKEYDRYLLRQHLASFEKGTVSTEEPGAPTSEAARPKDNVAASATAVSGSSTPQIVGGCQQAPRFRPNVMQQAIRAFLHMVQFAIAYFVML